MVFLWDKNSEISDVPSMERSYLVFLILLLAPWNAFLFMKLHLSGTNFCPRNLSFSGQMLIGKGIILSTVAIVSWEKLLSYGNREQTTKKKELNVEPPQE